MKHYPKTFEDVFTNQEYVKNLELDLIEVQNGMDLDEYINLMDQTYKEFWLFNFSSVVKQIWLADQFGYNGLKYNHLKGPKYRSLINHFAIFIRNIVGHSWSPIKNNLPNNKMATYIIEFFPDRANHSPFDEPEYYKFPFENISPELLLPVYQMPERMELLKYANEKKMSYVQFIDYVINWTYSYNEEKGKNLYIFVEKTFEKFPYFRYVYYGHNKYKTPGQKI